MRNVYVHGTGTVPVGEHWESSLLDLATKAALIALDSSESFEVGACVVGNMLSGIINHQENLGAIVADALGLEQVEAVKIEAACASGTAALRAGYLRVASGLVDNVLVVGAEKMSDIPAPSVIKTLSTAAPFHAEVIHGASFVSLNAILTQMYLRHYNLSQDCLGIFARQAHKNGTRSPHAMFQKEITVDQYKSSPIVCPPVRLLDCPPTCDGAAAIVLSSNKPKSTPIKLAAVEGANDWVALADRENPLQFRAAQSSARKAFKAAKLTQKDIDLFELHDAFPVLAALALESLEMAPPGNAWKEAEKGTFSLNGKLPIQTMGGLKSRGHPVGATGVYQAVEAVLQLRGEAGAAQVKEPKVALTQTFAGLAASVYSAIFQKEA